MRTSKRARENPEPPATPALAATFGAVAVVTGLAVLAMSARVGPIVWDEWPLQLLWWNIGLAVTLPAATGWRRGDAAKTIGIPMLIVATVAGCIFVVTLVYARMKPQMCAPPARCEGLGIFLAALPVLGVALVAISGVLGGLARGAAWLVARRRNRCGSSRRRREGR